MILPGLGSFFIKAQYSLIIFLLLIPETLTFFTQLSAILFKFSKEMALMY